jgi:uncharacterized protein (TIGR02453 family)
LTGRNTTHNFTGFSNDLYVFLNDLAANNDKLWFAANKERYLRFAKEPAVEFVIAMKEKLEGISSSYIADPRTNGGSIFRIYRDTRFAKDKRPFKENIGFQFRHVAGKDAHAPGFYVHVQPGNTFAGGGIWLPPTQVLNRVRDAIAGKVEEWEKIKQFIAGSGNISITDGDRLKRPPRGYPADHPLIEDLKRKTIVAGRSFEDREVTTHEFIDSVEEVFIDLVPLMRFINDALGLSF